MCFQGRFRGVLPGVRSTGGVGQKSSRCPWVAYDRRRFWWMHGYVGTWQLHKTITRSRRIIISCAIIIIVIIICYFSSPFQCPTYPNNCIVFFFQVDKTAVNAVVSAISSEYKGDPKFYTVSPSCGAKIVKL